MIETQDQRTMRRRLTMSAARRLNRDYSIDSARAAKILIEAFLGDGRKVRAAANPKNWAPTP